MLDAFTQRGPRSGYFDLGHPYSTAKKPSATTKSSFIVPAGSPDGTLWRYHEHTHECEAASTTVAFCRATSYSACKAGWYRRLQAARPLRKGAAITMNLLLYRYRVNAIVAWAVIAIVLFLLVGIIEGQVASFVCFDVCPFRESLFAILLYYLIPFLPGAICALIASLLCASILSPGMPRLRVLLLMTPVIIAALLAVFALVGYTILPIDENGQLSERGIEPYMLLWAASATLLFIAWAGGTAWLARSRLRQRITQVAVREGEPTPGL